MSWSELVLGECFKIKHGFAFKGEYFSDTGQHVILTPGNFREPGGFRARPGKDRFYSIDPPDNFILKPNDLVIAMTEQGEGLLGSSAMIPSEGSYLHNQRIGLIEELDEGRLDKLFLYHLFNTPLVRGKIRASATGGKVRHTAPKRIYEIKVRAPEVREQRKIAEAISAYDDLIENNRRRIALLEEAARMLYREWFVHFRFPGHEHVKIIDGLPEAWELRPVAELAELKGGKQIENDLIATTGDIPVYGGNGIQGFTDRKTHDGFVIAFGRVGAYCGSVHWSYRGAWINNNASSLVPNDYQELVLHHLLGCDFTNFRKGAAQPFIPNSVLSTIAFKMPPDGLARAFCEYAHDCRLQQVNLNLQIQKLAQARDLLLPRLMNGEIAV